MIEVLIDVAKLMVAIFFGTYISSKIMKRELKKEISGYILNELPHLFENQGLRSKPVNSHGFS